MSGLGPPALHTILTCAMRPDIAVHKLGPPGPPFINKVLPPEITS